MGHIMQNLYLEIKLFWLHAPLVHSDEQSPAANTISNILQYIHGPTGLTSVSGWLNSYSNLPASPESSRYAKRQKVSNTAANNAYHGKKCEPPI